MYIRKEQQDFLSELTNFATNWNFCKRLVHFSIKVKAFCEYFDCNFYLQINKIYYFFLIAQNSWKF